MAVHTTIALVILGGVIAATLVIKASEKVLSTITGSTTLGVAWAGVVATVVGAGATVAGTALATA